jgi:VWFA-related protein
MPSAPEQLGFHINQRGDCVRIRLLFPGLLLLLSLPVFAQNQDAVTVEVVDVPVYVTRHTQPVKGLTKDDFELYVNGKRQDIEYFDVVNAGNTALAGNEGGHPLRERRLFMLLFDVTFSGVHSLGRAQRAAADLIARSPSSDYFAVAMFSARRGVWFASPFTRDRVALARAVSSLTKTGSGDPLAIVMTARERLALDRWASTLAERSDPFFQPSQFAAEGGAARGRAAADEAETLAINEHLAADIWITQVRRVAENQIFDFTDLTARLATLQGQKHVVLLSDGFDGGSPYQVSSETKAATMASFSLGPNGLPDVPNNLGLSPSGGRIMTVMRAMHRAFQASDILLHTIDLKGVYTLMGNDALAALAHGTGGTFVHNRNDLGNALVELSASYSQSYVLGFRPRGARPNHNNIEVKLHAPIRGTTIQYRKGFDATPDPVNVTEGLYLADVVLNDVPQTGTAPVLTVRPGAVEVRLPIRQLAAQAGKDGKVDLLVYSFGSNGTALGFYREVVKLPADASVDPVIQVPLPAGTTTVKALLAVKGSLGFTKASL